MIECKKCKGTDILEQIWVRVNEHLVKVNEVEAYPVAHDMTDKTGTTLWCSECNEEVI